jgi:hypothetical protein
MEYYIFSFYRHILKLVVQLFLFFGEQIEYLIEVNGKIVMPAHSTLITAIVKHLLFSNFDVPARF